jgi:hypothetical protein
MQAGEFRNLLAMNGKPAPRGTKPTWPLLAGLLVALVILGVTIGRRLPDGGGRDQAEAAVQAEPSATATVRTASRPSQARRPVSPELRQERRRAAQAAQERKGRSFHQALAARHASEPVDAAWASAKEAKLLAASATDEIRRANALPGNYSANCRSTVCRIGADFPSRGAAEDWLTLFSTGVGSELPNEAYIVSRNPDGSIHLDVMGLARK